MILGKDYGNEVEVVSGLNENDLVISNPPDSLASGATVQVVNVAPDVRWMRSVTRRGRGGR